MSDDFVKKPPLPGPPPQTVALLTDHSRPASQQRTIFDPRDIRRIYENGAKDVGIKFRGKEKQQISRSRNGIQLSSREARILDCLKRERKGENDGWTTATQIRKTVGDHEAKSVRKALDRLSYFKLVEWTPMQDQVVGYRYIPGPDEVLPNLPDDAIKLGHLIIKKLPFLEVPKVELAITMPKLPTECKPSESPRYEGGGTVPAEATLSTPPDAPALTKGKRVLFMADRKNPENEERIEAALGAASIEWGIFETRSPRFVSSLCESIELGRFDIVLGAIGFMGHSTNASLSNACKKADIPYVPVQKGRVGAVLRALERYNTAGAKITQEVSVPPPPAPTAEKQFRPSDTLLPILKTILRLSPDAPISFKEVVLAVLEEMGLGLDCMGNRDGRPNVYTPFVNGAQILAHTHGCLTVEGREWSLTEIGKEAAQSGQILARVIHLPVATPVPEAVEESEPEASEEIALEPAPKKKQGPLGQTIVPWSGAELFRLEKLHDAKIPGSEILVLLNEEFGVSRTLRAMRQAWFDRFSEKRSSRARSFPQEYYDLKEAEAKGTLPVSLVAPKPVIEAPPIIETPPVAELPKPIVEAPKAPPVIEVAKPEAPKPVPVVSIPPSAPKAIPTRLRVSTVSGEVEAEILDPASGNFLVQTKRSLAQILGFLRTGTRSEPIHAEIVGGSGSFLMDTKRDIDEILMFLVG